MVLPLIYPAPFFQPCSRSFPASPQRKDFEEGVIPVLTWPIRFLLKYSMTILPTKGRYIFFFAALLLMLQVVVGTGQNKKSGVTVSYEQSGSSRIARFTNSNSYPVRVEFSYQGTRARGSGEASGEGSVFVAANFFATYGASGLSIASVRIKSVMRSD